MNTLNFRDACYGTEYQCSLHETCLVANAVLLLQPYPHYPITEINTDIKTATG